MTNQPIIQINHLRKVFGSGETQIVALDDVSLSINQGEIFGIIGLSGAGKSTLVRCMNMLETPTSGTVLVNGKEMTSLNAKELRKARLDIGMIFQGFNLLMQRNALDNICFPLEIAGMRRSKALARAKEMLEVVGLSDRGSAYPAQLSGGQKQRIAIARALATNPKVLLCDEATSALDPTTTQSILALIKELNQKLGVTVVIITHEMRVIEQVCSRVAIISKSHIEESGPVSEVFLRPRTEAARKLIFPDGKKPDEGFSNCGPTIRMVYDGNTNKPTVANMVLSCGTPVNILFGDTRLIDGKIYGQMVIQLPEDPRATASMLAYLDDEGISYEMEAQ